VRELDAGANPITSEGAVALCRTLKSNATLTSLGLTYGIYSYVYKYIFIYIYREREREIEIDIDRWIDRQIDSRALSRTKIERDSHVAWAYVRYIFIFI